MNKIKQTLLVTASALAISSSVLAADIPVTSSDVQIKLSAFAEFQAGLVNQSKLSSTEKNVSAGRKNFAFFNRNALAADLSNKVNDATYGAKIVLVPTAKRKGGLAFDGSHLYIESEFGRFEAGSPFSASSKLLIGSSDIEAGSGLWSNYAKADIAHLKQGGTVVPSFATSADFFMDDRLLTDSTTATYSSEPARSVVYYTPNFAVNDCSKVQFGISYTPDSSNTGAGKLSSDSSGSDTRITTAYAAAVGQTTEVPGETFVFKTTAKNIVTGGVKLEHNFADGVDLQLALTGEHGKSTGSAKKYGTGKEITSDSVATGNYKLKDLRTYNIGAILNVGNFSYAASYGDLGKSFTTAEFHKTGRKTTYTSGAVAYKQGQFAVSVGYFKSRQYKNTVDAITVGTNYQLAPGFKPYAEITSFTDKGRSEFNPGFAKKSTRGTVALIGAKLSL